MWLDQRLWPALSAAAPIGFTNKHLISVNVHEGQIEGQNLQVHTQSKDFKLLCERP